MEITQRQKQLLQHMLGADARYKKNQWGFRNHFAASPNSKDCVEFEKMEEIGLVKSDLRFNHKYFFATKKGAEAIGFKPYQLRKTNLAV